MEAMAKARFVRVSPTKARRVVDLIRGRGVSDALAVLQYSPQAASEPVYKVVASAVAMKRMIYPAAARFFAEAAHWFLPSSHSPIFSSSAPVSTPRLYLIIDV